MTSLLNFLKDIFKNNQINRPKSDSEFDRLVYEISNNHHRLDLVDKLGKLAEEQGNINQFLMEINRILPQIKNPDLAASFTVKIGKWYAYLERNDYAIAYFNSALYHVPFHREAIEEICAFYERNGSPELARLFRQEATQGALALEREVKKDE